MELKRKENIFEQPLLQKKTIQFIPFLFCMKTIERNLKFSVFSLNFFNLIIIYVQCPHKTPLVYAGEISGKLWMVKITRNR